MGWVGFGPLPIDEANIEISYGLDPIYWNNGYITETCKEAIKYFFITGNYNSLYTFTDKNNLQSKCVLEKCGFQKLYTVNE
jgi:ribosomal-protein-alanine N-acetyltransferase